MFLKYLIVFCYTFFILLISFLLRGRLSKNIIRKFVHIFECVIWFLVVILFKNSFHIVIISSFLLMIDLFLNQIGLFKHIEPSYKTYGVTCFVASLFIMCVLYYFDSEFLIPGSIGFLILAIGDGISPFIGEFKSKFNFEIFPYKRLFSSLFIFIVSVVIIYSYVYFKFINVSYLSIVFIGFIATLLELVGSKGFDNLFIVLGVGLILKLAL